MGTKPKNSPCKGGGHINQNFKVMKQDLEKEMFAMNEAIHDLLRYSETLAQLAALANLQAHFVKLCGLIEK